MRTKILISLMLAISTTAAPRAAAQTFMFETGNTLLEKCQNKAPEYALACSAYIVGVVDGIKKDIFLGRAPDNCWPKQLAAKEVHDLVVKYLKAYPDQRSFPASLTVSVALNDAYPCQK
ncbi:MAG: Rap1a/Tai family immunity protein [Sphingobium sp.]|uniref:Rap1a/Tai family immunity protein n=1 Tax=Sphingobium sp. TaxID=1912891 RepID=UPI0029BF0A54|nr:Rap1a/Tai family immunity protein [Sphingobium sp.]MDX3908549.1 Rap1a/Tai family immunity protein [Sphingobium sp.]